MESHHQDQMDGQTIATLAQLAPERKTKRLACPAVPFMLIMPLLFVCTLVAAILPSVVIISSSSNSAINDAVAEIIVSTAQSASSSFLQQLQEIGQRTAIAADSPVMTNFITREVYNYDKNPELNLFLTKYIAVAKGSLAYYQRENLTGLMNTPTAPGFYNLTYFSSFTPDSVCWVDYGRTVSLCDTVDANTGQVSGNPFPNNFANFGDPALTPTSSLASVLYNCPESGAWQSALIYNHTFFAHARCPTGYTGKEAPFMALTAFEQDPNFFQFTAPTSSSRIFLMANENKLIIANQNISVANADNTDLIDVTKAEDPIIAELGTKLMDKYQGGIAKFPEFTNDQIQNYRESNGVIQKLQIDADGGADWITLAMKLALGTDDYALVVSMPQSQFTGSIQESVRNGAIVSGVVTAAGCVLGLLLTYAATRPLGKVIEGMSKATNFDFSMLEDGEFDERSIFSEIKRLQATFNTMIKAFAGAIRQNRVMLNSGSKRQPGFSNESSSTRTPYTLNSTHDASKLW